MEREEEHMRQAVLNSQREESRNPGWGQGQDDEEDEELRRAIEESTREMQLHEADRRRYGQAFSSFGLLKARTPSTCFPIPTHALNTTESLLRS